jgi:AcrR family transcriptional regulator
LGQGLGTIFGLITAFAITFIVMTFGIYMPADLISPIVVQDFLSNSDLEIRLAVVGTVLYPSALGGSSLGSVIGYGASGASVLMFLAWGTGGLIAGLMSKDFLPAILAGMFAAIIGAFLTWLLIFAISPGFDIAAIIAPASLLLLEVALEGAIYPAIACIIGALLGGGITRDR